MPTSNPSARSLHLLGLLVAGVGASLFSCKVLLAKQAFVHGADPLVLVSLRMVFAFPFYAAVLLWLERGRLGVLWSRDAALAAAVGIIGYHVASTLDFQGMPHVSATLERLLLYLYPTFVLAIQAAQGQRVRARDLGATAVAYAGLALLLRDEHTIPGASRWTGVLLILGAAACFAVFLVAAKPLIHRFGSVRFTCIAVGAASLTLQIQQGIVDPAAPFHQTPAVYGLAAAMAVFCTVIPTFLTNLGLRLAGAGPVGVMGTAGPVCLMLLAAVFLDEPLTLQRIVGACIVVGGCLLLTRPAQPAPPRSDRPAA